MNRATSFQLALALVAMAVVGWADLTASEMQGILLVVLLAALALGFAYPARPWRWGLAIGLGVVVAEIVALALGVEPVGFAHVREVNPGVSFTYTWSNVLESAIATIPALVAAYGGAWMRRAAGSIRSSPPA